MFRKRAPPSATVHVCNPCCLVPQIFCATHCPIWRYAQLQGSATQHAQQASDRVRSARQAQLAAGIAGISTCLTKPMRCFTNLQVRSHFRFCLLNILCEPTFFAINVVGCLQTQGFEIFFDQQLVGRGNIGSQGPLPSK